MLLGHQVFIDGCAVDKREALATTLATRFGADVDTIRRRLEKGRFRVKASVDLATAKKFVSYLEGLGAQCSVADAQGNPVNLGGQVAPPPAIGMSLAPEGANLSDNMSGQPSPPMAEPTPAPLDLAPPTPAPPPDAADGDPLALASEDFSLSGASEPAQAASGFGALDSGGLQLNSLDGESEDALQAEKAAEGKATPPGPVDEGNDALFMPPEAQAKEEFDLDVDAPAPRQTGSHDVVIPESVEMPVLAEKKPAPEINVSPGERIRNLFLGMVSTDRPRFALGVVVSLLLGFAVAHFVASSQEDARYNDVIEELLIDHRQADTIDAWTKLDGVRAAAKSDLENRQKRIGIMAIMVWLIVAGVVAVVWMRVIDWSRFERPMLAKMD